MKTILYVNTQSGTTQRFVYLYNLKNVRMCP